MVNYCSHIALPCAPSILLEMANESSEPQPETRDFRPTHIELNAQKNLISLC